MLADAVVLAGAVVAGAAAATPANAVTQSASGRATTAAARAMAAAGLGGGRTDEYQSMGEMLMCTSILGGGVAAREGMLGWAMRDGPGMVAVGEAGLVGLGEASTGQGKVCSRIGEVARLCEDAIAVFSTSVAKDLLLVSHSTHFWRLGFLLRLFPASCSLAMVAMEGVEVLGSIKTGRLSGGDEESRGLRESSGFEEKRGSEESRWISKRSWIQ